jgi:predicted transcriptional regulator of viral defense system
MHLMTMTPANRVLRLARSRGVLRPCDLDALGVPRAVLWQLCRQGRLERTARGQYRASDAPLTEHHGLARVGARVPHGVVCLLSALQFHDIGTQSPAEVWLALPRGAWQPTFEWPPVRFVRFSGVALTELAEDHVIEGVKVRVYTPAKTVADCFKFRNRVGLDVALEALRDVWRRRRCTMDQLWEAARVCRVANVMRPYLESLA